jgi:hypothetical protein
VLCATLNSIIEHKSQNNKDNHYHKKTLMDVFWNYFTNGGGRIKENDGGGEFNYDVLLKNIVNVTMYPHTTIIKKEKKLCIIWTGATKELNTFIQLILCWYELKKIVSNN